MFSRLMKDIARRHSEPSLIVLQRRLRNTENLHKLRLVQMDPIDINYLLRKNNSSQVAIARKLKVSRQMVSQVVHGVRPGHRVRKAIAKAVGRRVEDLWPDVA